MKRQLGSILFAAAGMLMLILDTRTALSGAAQGIALCLQTIIPSLFPFIFLSTILTSSLAGASARLFRPVGHFCGMPQGSESLLLVGLLGGYPTGAVCISKSYRDGQLNKEQAERLLGFCNNAGPAFLFGMAGSLFTRACIPWLLWGIHIIAALLTAHCIPKTESKTVSLNQTVGTSPAKALHHAVTVMAGICGWVVLFKIVITFCDNWLLWLLPPIYQCIFNGFLELSNGCCSLIAIDSESIRFLLVSAFLAFGGFCIMMQTRAVTEGLSLRWFIVGKFLQCLISTLFSALLLPLIFPDRVRESNSVVLVVPLLIGAILFFSLFLKIKVAFPIQLMYNKEKTLKR